MANKLITKETLKEWRACVDGFKRFVELFPDGADLDTAVKGLAEDGHPDWGIWLVGRCRESEDDAFSSQAQKGFLNTGYRNTGDRNTGYCNTGYCNTGSYNVGHRNTGDRNTGYCNTGSYNVGHRNIGDNNTGDINTGDNNTGNWNTGDSNTGFFNTVTPDEMLVFNKTCSRAVWNNTVKPYFIFNVQPTYWVDANNMTDEEKKADPNFWARGGQLRSRTYKEAWRKAWDDTTPEDRALVLKLPNFDAAVFLEITGIDVGDL